MKKARKKAKRDHINEKTSQLSERYAKIADSMAALEGVDIEQEMQVTSDCISETEEGIAAASGRNRKLLEQVYAASAELEKSEFLQDRYRALEAQYLSGMRRLRFIVDGEMKPGGRAENARCPFATATCQSTNTRHILKPPRKR